MFSKKTQKSTESTVNLSSPWATLRNKIDAMFAKDEGVHVSDVIVDNEHYEIKVYVDNPIKYTALNKLLKPVHEIGNVKVYVTVIPANTDESDAITIDTYKNAFANNPIVSDFNESAMGPAKELIEWVIFDKEIIQFYNDDLSDFYRNYNGLPTEIASEIFNQSDIQFSIKKA